MVLGGGSTHFFLLIQKQDIYKCIECARHNVLYVAKRQIKTLVHLENRHPPSIHKGILFPSGNILMRATATA